MVIAQKKTQTTLIQVDAQKPFNWVSLPIQKVFEADLRLEASVYATDAEKAKQAVLNCKFGTVALNELISTNHCPRFKRVFVKTSAYPIYQPSQIKEVKPLPAAYISDKTDTDIELLRVRKGQILMTCSGTVGKVTYVSNTLSRNIFSHDLLRINAKNENDIGYLYTFFLSDIGRLIVQSNNYGAVIQHIEPAHLLNLPIPNAPKIFKDKINSLVKESFELRDKSNELIERSQSIFKSALSLPSVEEFSTDEEYKPNCFSVSVANLNGRFEANFHHPVAQAILKHLEKNAEQLCTLGDKKLVSGIVLPGIFKRHYVQPEHGVPYIGGKDILSLDPRNERYLSISQHKDLIEDKLSLRENMLLVTCSGTIGKVTLVPKHWQGWVASHDLLRVLPNRNFEGYLYAWLSSEWAQPLIRRYTYGAVVPHIDQHHVADVAVPLLEASLMYQINQLILDANHLRFLAFEKEQEALNIFNTLVI
ncbi:restriction endonuclease subunit S [Enterobacter asburiae]|jgi:type I restriction enzyme S subunit|uniref:restriction endonuclease subunit S n=1 Tax=Enterobacter asburiae TaxID=61645 RepID=UPI002175BC59|nr:restriction endonuclease subunit S [Enterobacter asburiae]MCS5454452.1 restriction endonuclease subunit S [Enterobacter asburiae]